MTVTSDPDVALLAALADPIRLSIVRQLGLADEVCVCDLDACARVSQPTVSHHLRILREAGVIRGERRGTWVHYSLEPAAIERLASIARSLAPLGRAVDAPPEPEGERGRGTRLPVLDWAGA